jgi:hypothetical protein
VGEERTAGQAHLQPRALPPDPVSPRTRNERKGGVDTPISSLFEGSFHAELVHPPRPLALPLVCHPIEHPLVAPVLAGDLKCHEEPPLCTYECELEALSERRQAHAYALRGH